METGERGCFMMVISLGVNLIGHHHHHMDQRSTFHLSDPSGRDGQDRTAAATQAPY